jgi:carboxyl-terminal processing protease
MYPAPAYKTDILSEDRIVKIDDKSMADMSGNEALSLMWGKAGKKVKIAVLRNGVLGEIEFDLVREKIKIKTVEKTLFDDGKHI